VAVFAAIAEAHKRFGRLDVVVNNAGYGLFGAIEEVSEAQARAQLDEASRMTRPSGGGCAMEWSRAAS
jgi:NAD(P)-dependent dehydrogenase (short-subunit alcohol dehydrogenase family)